MFIDIWSEIEIRKFKEKKNQKKKEEKEWALPMNLFDSVCQGIGSKHIFWTDNLGSIVKHIY